MRIYAQMHAPTGTNTNRFPYRCANVVSKCRRLAAGPLLFDVLFAALTVHLVAVNH